jgi:acetylornithine deacetylase/succinyl-diaminopimelate desuccinylase-like protein
MQMDALVSSAISGDRLAARTIALVSIPSPTGMSDAVSERYAELLAELGLDVTIDRHYPGGPNVIGRWRGAGRGPTLALVGHLDTIHAAHAAPYRTDQAVHGRGADDMKGSMAAIIEAVGALRAADVRLHGDLVIAAHSLHEAPVGQMQGLRRLVASGALGDAALVAESFPAQHQILAGKGQAIFTIAIRRDGESVHENYAAAGTINPLDVAADLAARLRAQHRALVARGPIALLGPETLFIGEIHGGDFYNRVPVEARISGIRRFGPERSWGDIEAEFAEILAPFQQESGITLTLELGGNGLGYRVAEDAPIVHALASAHQTVTGQPLPIAGTKSVTDANIIVREGRIPALCYGPSGTTAHADQEWVAIRDLERAARVYAHLVCAYPGLAAPGYTL